MRCDVMCTEVVGIASLLAAVLAVTYSYYPGGPIGLIYSSSGLLGIYAASTISARRYALSAVLLALAIPSALLLPFTYLAAVPLLASIGAFALLAPGRPSLMPLSASSALIQLFPPLALLPALSSTFRGRVHMVLLPAGYLVSGALAYGGLRLQSSIVSLAASAILAAYVGHGFTRCPFREERGLVNIGLALLVSLAILSFLISPRVILPLLAGSIYVFLAGLLAPKS